jgi:hypothetical protein
VITVSSNPLAGIEADIDTWADHLKSAVVPAIHDGAELVERFSKSAVVQEIEQLAEPLDPEIEAAIVAIIRGAGSAAAKIAQLTAPEPDTPVGVDAEPEPPA